MKLSLPIPKAKVSLVDLFSHPKLKDYLLGLIIFFAPTQLGLHFWPNSSLVYGVRVDYLAPTLYFLDLLIFSYLAIQFRTLPERACLRRQVFGTFAIINTTLPLLLTNLLYSQNPLATLSWSLHLLLYLSFLATLSFQFRTLRDDRQVFGTFAIHVLFLSLLFQLSLALAQVLLGHSVGGLLYYLGERTVSVGQPAVAIATFMGHVVLRAYGTFSHPNILAGWLVIVCLIILRLVGLQLPNSINQRAVRGSDLLGRTLLIPTVIVLTTLGLLLTQSRSAALAFFGLIIPFYIIQKTKFRTLFIYFLLFGVTMSFVTGVFSRPLDLSITERLSLQSLSLQTARTFPIFGTGAQANISTYPVVAPTHRLLQPDHNSFTLLLSWFGLFGLIVTLCIIHNTKYVIHALPLLPLLLLDHYLLTSPQGLFILLLYIKLNSSKL